MDLSVRQFVRSRAGDRCEYCRLPQHALAGTFHVEHVVARPHHGKDNPSNLALACDSSNLFKGPNLAGIDPETGLVVTLFHPRLHTWSEEFEIRDTSIEGRTPTGRATVRLLRMNDQHRTQLRAALKSVGEW